MKKDGNQKYEALRHKKGDVETPPVHTKTTQREKVKISVIPFHRKKLDAFYSQIF
jgi:hypothetical protein